MASSVGVAVTDHDLAVFRRAEQDFAVVEIFADLFVGRRRNVAGLCRTERHVSDAAFFVLELIDGVEPGPRRRDVARHRIDDLAAHRGAALIGDEALFREIGVEQRILKSGAVEFAVRRLECRIAGDTARDFGVGEAEPHLRGALVETCLRNHLAEHLPLQSEGAGLFRRDRLADLPRQRINSVLIGLAELIGADFGLADGGKRRAAEAVENVVDTP